MNKSLLLDMQELGKGESDPGQQSTCSKRTEEGQWPCMARWSQESGAQGWPERLNVGFDLLLGEFGSMRTPQRMNQEAIMCISKNHFGL